METEILLKMTEIDKRFPGVHALKKVSFQLKTGEVHALLGENGAGKSTLMNILGGVFPADSGRIEIKGKPVSIEKVSDAQKHGVAVIHQELVLVPHMTIAENVFMGREPKTSWGTVDTAFMEREAQRMIRRVGLELPACTIVGSLSVAQQQMVEIAKALSLKANILVMDEPTSSLTEKEVQVLFQIVKRLKREGVGIIYISHRMSELFEITDRITVMRDGMYIETKLTKETDTDELVALMVGRKLENYYTRNYRKPGKVTLEVRNLGDRYKLKNISFLAREGEILGFSGLIGAGRSELMQAIVGLEPYTEGTVLISGKEQKGHSYQDRLKQGLAFVPEDRKKQGLILINSVAFNLTITVLKEFIHGVAVSKKKEERIAERSIENLRIKVSGHNQIAGNLSGGNQQKILIGKWLATNPKILIVDEPTRGVDVGAKADIYAIIDGLAAKGITIIMVSSDLNEIMNMCDRVIVMKNGRITGEVSREELSQERIMQYATDEGGKTDHV